MKVTVDFGDKESNSQTYSFDEALANPGVYQFENYSPLHRLITLRKNHSIWMSNDNIYTKAEQNSWTEHKFEKCLQPLVLTFSN